MSKKNPRNNQSKENPASARNGGCQKPDRSGRGKDGGRGSKGTGGSNNKAERDPKVKQEEEEVVHADKSTQHPSWYKSADDSLFNANTLNLEFMHRTGENIDLVDTATKGSMDKIHMPGLMSMTLIQGPGVTHFQGLENPVAQATRALYVNMLFKKGKLNTITAPTFMQYLNAMDSFTAALDFVARAYRSLNVFASGNFYMPRVWFKAMHLDYANWVSSCNTIPARFNALVNEFNTWCYPALFGAFIRHRYVYQNIYIDTPDSTKGQMYMFNPAGFYVWDEMSKPAKLKYTKLTDWMAGDDMTVDEAFTMLNDIWNGIKSSEDFMNINASMIVTYGGDKGFKFAPLIPGETLVPIPDAPLLNQFQNATISVDPSGWSHLDITEDLDNNVVVWKPDLTPHPELTFAKLLTTSIAAPTGDDIIEMTRLATPFEMYEVSSEPQTYITRPSSSSVDIACGLTVYTMNDTYTGYEETQIPYGYYVNSNTTQEQFIKFMKLLNARANFRYAPFMGIFTFDEKLDPVLRTYLFDVDQFAVLSHHEANNLNKACLLGAWNMPVLGQQNSGASGVNAEFKGNG